MDLPAIANMIADLKLWRETDLAAQQDVDDAEAHVIAADLKLQDARRRHKQIQAKIEALQRELADTLDDMTAPLEIVFLPEEDCD